MNSYQITAARDHFHYLIRKVEKTGVPVALTRQRKAVLYVMPVCERTQRLAMSVGCRYPYSYGISGARDKIFLIASKLQERPGFHAVFRWREEVSWLVSVCDESTKGCKEIASE